MFKMGMLLGGIWLAVFVYLLLQSISRYAFDLPSEDTLDEYRPGHLFLARLGVSFLWPLMLFSRGGRRVITYIMKDE